MQAVYSKQNKHPVCRYTILPYLDFTFALAGHEEFIGRRFVTHAPFHDLTAAISSTTPNEVTPNAANLDAYMIREGHLPFHFHVLGIPDSLALLVRQQVLRFCKCSPIPRLHWITDLQNVRGLQQTKKLGDCTTEWLHCVMESAYDAQWLALLSMLESLNSS